MRVTRINSRRYFDTGADETPCEFEVLVGQDVALGDAEMDGRQACQIGKQWARVWIFRRGRTQGVHPERGHFVSAWHVGWANIPVVGRARFGTKGSVAEYQARRERLAAVPHPERCAERQVGAVGVAAECLA